MTGEARMATRGFQTGVWKPLMTIICEEEEEDVPTGGRWGGFLCSFHCGFAADLWNSLSQDMQMAATQFWQIQRKTEKFLAKEKVAALNQRS